MNFKTTIAMVSILVLLLAIYFFAFRGKKQTDYQEKKTIGEAYEIKKSDITKFRLDYKDESLEAFTLVRDENEGWKFVEPINASADEKKVDKLLKDLIDRRIKRRIKPASELTKYGLDEPKTTFTVWTKGKSWQFLVGNEGISYSVYAKEAEDDSVFTVEHTVLEYFSKSSADLRDKSIFDFETDKVTKFELNYPDRSIVCEFNSKDREWEIVEPIQTKADYNEVNKFLNKLNELEIEVFERLNNLFKVNIEITVSTEYSEMTLQIGDKVPEANRVYAKHGNSSIYSISEDAVAELTKTVYSLRNKEVLDFQRADVTKFIIERSDVKITCERNSKDEWSIVEPFKAKADESSIGDFLFKLDALKAKEFLGNPAGLKDLKKYGLGPPSMDVILFERKKNSPKEVKFNFFGLLVGAQKDDMLYVIGNSPKGNQVYLVENDILEEVSKKPSDFRDKRITDFYSGDVVELGLNYDDQSITCKKYGDDWRISQPVNVDADDSKVNNVLYILNKIQAKEFVSEHSSLRNPRVSAKLKLNDGMVYTLLVGDNADSESAYAKVKEIEGTFTIDKSIVKKLKPSVDELRN